MFCSRPGNRNHVLAPLLISKRLQARARSVWFPRAAWQQLSNPSESEPVNDTGAESWPPRRSGCAAPPAPPRRSAASAAWRRSPLRGTSVSTSPEPEPSPATTQPPRTTEEMRPRRAKVDGTDPEPTSETVYRLLGRSGSTEDLWDNDTLCELFRNISKIRKYDLI